MKRLQLKKVAEEQCACENEQSHDDPPGALASHKFEKPIVDISDKKDVNDRSHRFGRRSKPLAKNLLQLSYEFSRTSPLRWGGDIMD